LRPYDGLTSSEDTPAMTQNRIFDDLGRLMNSAAGVADGVRREAETAFKAQLERIVADMDLVKREDFEALRELVQSQERELAELRTELAALRGSGPSTTP
jgi:BMFP domain-containing protein YqiC